MQEYAAALCRRAAQRPDSIVVQMSDDEGERGEGRSGGGGDGRGTFDPTNLLCKEVQRCNGSSISRLLEESIAHDVS